MVMDDYSRFTWINFIKEKSNNFEVFKDLCQRFPREKKTCIIKIRSDHGKEFENAKLFYFSSSEGIFHEFSTRITLQENGVVERKNKTLQELAIVILHAKKLPYHFWAEAMNTACYIHNHVTLRTGTTSTLYEMWKGRKPIVKYFISLEVNATYWLTENREERWIVRVMEAFFLAILQIVEPIEYIIPEQKL